jgi:hypothetical protein
MSTAPGSYTDAEIRAFSRLSWWEYAAKAGLPTRVGPRRIERGPYYAAKQKPVRDYLSEPLDYLSLPLPALLRRR